MSRLIRCLTSTPPNSGSTTRSLACSATRDKAAKAGPATTTARPMPVRSTTGPGPPLVELPWTRPLSARARCSGAVLLRDTGWMTGLRRALGYSTSRTCPLDVAANEAAGTTQNAQRTSSPALEYCEPMFPPVAASQKALADRSNQSSATSVKRTKGRMVSLNRHLWLSGTRRAADLQGAAD